MNIGVRGKMTSGRKLTFDTNWTSCLLVINFVAMEKGSGDLFKRITNYILCLIYKNAQSEVSLQKGFVWEWEHFPPNCLKA